MQRNSLLVQREHAGLLIIDIQDRVVRVVQHPKRVVFNSIKLIEGFKILTRPVWLTEQYPKGLGPTNAEVLAALPPNLIPREKIRFSCCGDAELLVELRTNGVRQIIVTGVESHVCVFQSAMDLLANDFQVFVVRDAVSSRRRMDWQTAMKRLQRAGAIITTTEAVLFEMLEAAGSAEFKAISRLVK